MTIINVDVNKINKERLTERKYKDKDGKEVTAKELKLELINLKEPKVVTSGAGWRLEKTHFVTEARTKEERADKIKMPIIGDGVQFVSDDTTDHMKNDDRQIPF